MHAPESSGSDKPASNFILNKCRDVAYNGLKFLNQGCKTIR